MSLYSVIKHAIGAPEPRQVPAAMAQITIISTEPVKRPSGSRSPRAQV